MSENGAFRKKRVYFSQVSNSTLRDTNLSLKAKGLYSLIQSYITLENFTLYKNTLFKNCKEGEKAFESAWKELKDTGWLIQYKIKTKEGHFKYEYDLLDELNHTPKTEVVDSDGVVTGDVENGESGNGGAYNDTLPSNTDSNNIFPLNTEKKNIYISLDTDDSFLYIYNLYFMMKYRKDHMKVEKKKHIEVEDWIVQLTANGIDRATWEKAVKEHFKTLPKSNNGNILAFMAASKRYFDVDPPHEEYMEG